MHRHTKRAWLAAAVLLAVGVASVKVAAWGPQGHRLVALLAAAELTPIARQNVQRLLGEESMADVAVWADEYLVGVNQTAPWHYVNIPPDARSYDRDRDCPRQPGVNVGARGDVWRDCVVDRIRYNEERLADAKLDRIDRAIALKFSCTSSATSISPCMRAPSIAVATAYRFAPLEWTAAAGRRSGRLPAICTRSGTRG